jgi:amidohydrolase
MPPPRPSTETDAQRLDPEVMRAAEELYRDLHRHPELGWKEQRSAARVTAFLADHGVPVSTCAVEPGIVVDIAGEKPGARVLLRADLDALPIQEETDLPYRSEVAGVMHACGHDLHAAMMAALAVHEQRRRGELAGALRLVWQPSEEANPSGAEAMVAAGIADDCRAAMALHVDPRLDTGRIAFREGVTNAAVDGLGITLRGPGGHGARPHLAPDLVRVSALLVLELGDLVRRTVPAQEAAVLTITTIQTGKRSNIIPDHAWMDGTLRTLSIEARDAMIDAVREVLEGITALHHVRYELDVRTGQPSLKNDAVLSQLAREVALEVLGPGSVHEMEQPSLGADDFSVFSEKAPIMMVRLGTRSDPAAPPADIHTPRFQVDPLALPIGVRYLRALAGRAAVTPL